MKQRYVKKQPSSPQDVQQFVERGFPLPIAEALSGRGITVDNYSEYFQDCFHSPFEMKNMQEAVDTVSYVLEEGGCVLIYGDYDADGLTASSILSLFFTDNGIENDVIIPTRNEGYGLHADLVISAFQKKFYDLIITVDCGISNRDDVAKIVDELGAEIIVTDHHELPELLPDCICVNPKMGYPFPYLAGAGVAWKLVEALAGRDVAARYAQLAMIGTIGDIMPMQDENRSIVKLGFANQNHKSLQKIAELSKCLNPSTSDISLRIAPKINAAGRVGCPDVALKLLLSRDKTNTAIVEKLIQLNEKRQELVNTLMSEADEMCNDAQIRNDRLVFLHSENWPHGLLGIAASRYKEKYNFPAALLTRDGDMYVGSARGTDNVNLFEIFSQCKYLLPKFGGHKASVGFSVLAKDLPVLQQKLSQTLQKLPDECFEKVFFYDFDLDGTLTLQELYNFTQTLQPLLPQEKVLFHIRDSVKFANAFGKEGSHISIVLSNGMEVKGFFDYAAFLPFIKGGADLEMLVSLELDPYNKNVCGILEDMYLCNSVCFDSFYKQNLLQNFIPQTVPIATQKQVEKALQGSSVLAVFDDYESYLKAAEFLPLGNYFVDIFFDKSLSQRTVAISPLANYNFEKYSQVVCFCKQGMVRNLPQNTIYFQCIANQDLYTLHLNRDLCAAVYSKLKHKGTYDSLRSVFDKYLIGKLSYEQYLVALRVFEELKFIQIKDKYTVEFLPSAKADLTTSQIFCCFQK